MIERLLRPWPTRLFLNRISKWVILITLALSVIVVGISIYAENVGNFIISIGGTERQSLVFLNGYNPETGTYQESTNTLFAPPIEDLMDATYDDIPGLYDDEWNPGFGLLSQEGGHSDEVYKKYYAYSFYLSNVGEIPVDYNMVIDIKALTKGFDPVQLKTPKFLDESLRIMVIRSEYKDGVWQPQDGDMNVDTGGVLTEKDEREMKNDLRGKTIYAKRDADGTQPQYLDLHNRLPKRYVTLPFNSTKTPVVQKVEQFGTKQVYKYTLVMWLEGNDPDCDDGIQGAEIRMTCDFVQTSPTA